VIVDRRSASEARGGRRSDEQKRAPLQRYNHSFIL
jgi:hypothetical protein